MKGGSDNGWLAAYLPAAWAGHICQVCKIYQAYQVFIQVLLKFIALFVEIQQKLTRFHILQGLAMGILGPTQPYLAKQVFLASL